METIRRKPRQTHNSYARMVCEYCNDRLTHADRWSAIHSSEVALEILRDATQKFPDLGSEIVPVLPGCDTSLIRSPAQELLTVAFVASHGMFGAFVTTTEAGLQMRARRLLAKVKQWALVNYNKGGSSIIEEFPDEEIVDSFPKLAEAKRYCQQKYEDSFHPMG